MSRTIIYFHVYIILDIPITYRNASVLVMKIHVPTQKGEHSFKCTELSL